MSTPESKLQNKCILYAKTLGVLSYKFKSPANAGVPDVVFIDVPGVFFVEFKRPRTPGKPPGKLRPLQIHTIKKFEKKGASVYVCDNFADFKFIVHGFIDPRSTCCD